MMTKKMPEKLEPGILSLRSEYLANAESEQQVATVDALKYQPMAAMSLAESDLSEELLLSCATKSPTGKRRSYL